MKQVQFVYENEEKLREQLRRIAAAAETFHGRVRKEETLQGEGGGSGGHKLPMLFHVFSTEIDREKLLVIRDVIREEIPEAYIVGATTNGNIFRGKLSDDILVTCSMFEDSSTKMETMHFPLSVVNEVETAEKLVEEVNARPWVTGVELLLMIRGMSMTSFCEKMAGLREDVCVFGGGCFASDIYDNEAIALEKSGGCDDHLVVVLYGGPKLHIRTDRVTGWKPLGQSLMVTKADHNGRVYELDGKPAYDIYYHYLHIANDAHFFENTLEFPFLYDNRGVTLLRAPFKCYPDGSLQMTSDMEQGGMARIGFGDPVEILQKVSDTGQKIEAFGPEAVLIFSCAARKTFWGETGANRETLPFETLAPTSGFYTSGEFIREKSELQQNNVSLVIASFREGEKSAAQEDKIKVSEQRDAGGEKIRHFRIEGLKSGGQVSVIARLANFVEAATQELGEANRELASSNRKLESVNAELAESNAKFAELNQKLEQVNEILEKQSITDGLTGLLNRREIQKRITDEAERLAEEEKRAVAAVRRIYNARQQEGYDAGRPEDHDASRQGKPENEAAKNKGTNGTSCPEEIVIPVPQMRRKSDLTSLIMIDLDFFKNVNDVWGHEEGDHVLTALSGMLRTFVHVFNENASVGRWGGEEFMILLPGNDEGTARVLAEQLREQFAALRFPAADPQTMSLGVTRILPGETADSAESRVDAALYEAKRNGRNRVEVKC